MTDRGTGSALAATRTTAPAPELTGRAAPWLAPWVTGPTRSLTPLDGRTGSHAYFRLVGTSQVVVLEGPAGLRLPIAIALTRLAFARATAGRQVKLGDNCLWVDDHPVTVFCAGDEPPHFGADVATTQRAQIVLSVLMAALPRPEAPPAVWQAVARFAAALETGDDVVTAAADLVGLGPGSTPAGDDVLAAATATLTAVPSSSRIEHRLTRLRAAIADCLDRTTSVSGALLEAAAEGHMIPRLAHCLERLVL
ncbi:MAG: DUF2877 domain-containing protein, partial [Alphaproteobacteria bacterium]|nr:DUF2877 domain-containing protein [Alphaproteobacteria bacterium]